MRRVLMVLSLFMLFSCGVSQDELEGIDGVWTLDSLSCFTSIGDANTQEIWAVKDSGSTLTLGITGRDISMTATSAACGSASYSLQYLFIQRDGLREGQLDFTVLTKNPAACAIELNFFNGIMVDPGTKYSFDLIPVANKLYNNYFQRVDDNTLLLELPSETLGSTLGSCTANCECYGAFVQ